MSRLYIFEAKRIPFLWILVLKGKRNCWHAVLAHVILCTVYLNIYIQELGCFLNGFSFNSVDKKISPADFGI